MKTSEPNASHTSDLSWIRPYLAIGAKPDPTTWTALEKAGIESIVDLNDHLDVRLEADRHGLTYTGIKVPAPTTLEDFLTFFPTVNSRIEEERDSGRKIYLHCTAGVYRTPTFAMAHLIAGGKSTKEAESVVRQAHTLTWTAGDPRLTSADEEILRQALQLWSQRRPNVRDLVPRKIRRAG